MSRYREFIYYLIIGTIATLIDWSTFALATHYFNIYYQASICIAIFTATIFHYLANKFVTFKCHSKQIASQLSIYGTVAVVTLLGSMAIMYLLINEFMFTKMIARVMTTGLMVIPNYLLHKYFSFSKRIFR